MTAKSSQRGPTDIRSGSTKYRPPAASMVSTTSQRGSGELVFGVSVFEVGGISDHFLFKR
jgi:hypothetical protein